MINIVPSGERDEKLRVLVSLLFFVDDLQNLLGFLMFESIGEVKKWNYYKCILYIKYC